MPTPSEPPKTYRGNCHCGSFIFELRTPEIIQSAIACNCSSCTKKGYLWLFVADDAVTVVKDEGKLAEYVCGPHGSTHKFCSICGTSVLSRDPGYRAGVAVNARTLQNLDIWKLETPIRDGAKINPQWDPPVYEGPTPHSPEIPGPGEVYHGSCRCGAVGVAMQLPGLLDASYEGMVVECNCSICQRGGYIWIYPKKEQIALQGADNLTGYVFGNKVWKKMFCKTCGVHVMTDLAPATEEQWQALEEGIRKENESRRAYRPLNVRCLNGFDPLSLKTRRLDGWGNLKPGYINP